MLPDANLLFEHIPAPLAHCRLLFEGGRPVDVLFLAVNPAFERVIGLHGVAGRRRSEVFPTSDVDPTAFDTYARVVSSGVSERFETRTATLNQWFSVSVFPASTDTFVTVFEPINRRKAAETRAYIRGSMLEAALASIADAVFISDAEGNFIEFNEAFATVHRFASKAECAKTLQEYPAFLEVCFANGVPAPLEQWAVPRALRGETVHNAEYQLRRKDTGESWIGSYSFAPILDEQHAIVGSVVVGRDITEQRRAAAERDALRDQLQHAQRMESVGRLAGGVAHDFNNLLTVQLGYCEMLRNELPPGDALVATVDQIQQCATRANALTRQLLAFSRRQALQPQNFDLNKLVANLAQMLQRLIGEDVDLVQQLSSAAMMVHADPGQLEQVLANLAVNARDAMPNGGKLTIHTARVEIDESYAEARLDMSPGPYVMLSVSDTGTGMDRETVGRIFEPFFTTKAEGKGTGLGLATVYGIVHQSGGSIWVSTELGKGTSFKICLPFVGATEAAVTAPVPDVRTGNGELVLVVEDEPALRRLTAMILTRLGYRVAEAENGGAALILVEEQGLRPDAIVTDVVMPGMSGRVLVDRLERTLPRLKVVFMSGYTDEAIVRHGVLEEGVNFMAKPFTRIDLATAVARALDAD